MKKYHALVVAGIVSAFVMQGCKVVAKPGSSSGCSALTPGCTTSPVTIIPEPSASPSSSSTPVSGGAVLQISNGDTYDFGTRGAGAWTTQEFTVSNTGDRTATGISAGALAGAYSYLGGAFPGTDGTCTDTLAASGSCTFVVKFTPISATTSNATITLTYNNGVTAGHTATRSMTGAAPASGTMVTGFGTNGHVTGSPQRYGPDTARAIAKDADGKVVIAGWGTYGQSSDEIEVTRLTIEGVLDTTFGVGGRVRLNPMAYGEKAYAVTIQSNGKIVVAGSTGTSGTTANMLVARLNSNGTLDTNFGSNGYVFVSTGLSRLEVAYGVTTMTVDPGTGPQEMIVIAGSSYASVESPQAYKTVVARITSDGSLDTTFNGTGFKRFNMSQDGNYNSEGLAVAIDRNAVDERIIVAGYGIDTGGTKTRVAAVRLLSDGSFDATFASAGKYFGVNPSAQADDRAYAVAVDTNYSVIYIGGKSKIAAGNYDFVLTRLNASNGSLENSFGTNGIQTVSLSSSSGVEEVRSILIQPDSNIVAVGTSKVSANAIENFAAARLIVDDGSLDPTFGTSGIMNFDFYGNAIPDVVYGAVLQDDGKIVIGGSSTTGTDTDFVAARVTSAGALDATYGTGGKVAVKMSLSDDIIKGSAVQADGKIVVAGSSGGTGVLWRYNVDGTLDATFGTNGVLIPSYTGYMFAFEAVAIQSDQMIVAVGYSKQNSFSYYNMLVMRFEDDGTLDNTFSFDGIAQTNIFPIADSLAHAVVIQDDGKIVVAGEAKNAANYNFAAARFNANGTLDGTFDTDGMISTAIGPTNSKAYAVALSGGKILLGGSSIAVGDGFEEHTLARYNSDGSLDTDFGTSGVTTATIGVSMDYVTSLVVLQDGSILTGGFAYMFGTGQIALSRFTTSGTLDTAFGTNGTTMDTIGLASAVLGSLAVTADGKILAGGSGFNGGYYQFGIVKLLADGSLDTSFNTTGQLAEDMGSHANFVAAMTVGQTGKVTLVGSLTDGVVNGPALLQIWQ